MNTGRRYMLLLAVALSTVVEICLPSPIQGRTLLEPGGATVWKYRDDGDAPEAAWTQPGFDDSSWKSGAAPLGFGESRLGTQIDAGPDADRQWTTAWFRCEFTSSELKPAEHLVILLCVDDGAVVYLNGREVGRENMPPGPPSVSTLARRVIGNDEEGFYSRLRVPAEAIRPGDKNVLAVEVHQAAAKSSDLYFDLAVKTLPDETSAAEVNADAEEVVKLFNARHYVGPGVQIPNGYLDGGRRMEIDARGHAESGREILQVDRSRDAALAADLAFARSDEIRSLPTRQRIQRLAARIDREMTPPGGARWVARTTEQLEKEFTNKPLLIGDWIDQCQAGVCRHRGLLFKILAEEAGLPTALVRGNYATKKGPPGSPHVWNEVTLDDGRRVVVDVMHHGGRDVFLDVTDPEVVRHYLKVDDTPWYAVEAN